LNRADFSNPAVLDQNIGRARGCSRAINDYSTSKDYVCHRSSFYLSATPNASPLTEAFLALRSYLSTAAKQGMNRLEALQRLFNGDTWMPATSGTSP
jgi:hypothetical protein